MNLMRNTIKDIDEYKINDSICKIKLDANEGRNILLSGIRESSLAMIKDIDFNLYPDNNATLLKERIGKYIGVDPHNLIVGNGSSEMIELVMKAFIDPGDIILSFIPTFGMYSFFSNIYSGRFIGVNSNEDFSLDFDTLISKAKKLNPKIIFLCNPNNPTGYFIKTAEIKKLLKQINSIIVVDEAYIDFAEGSIISEINNYKNLIVLRTFSKALGLAGLRLGYMATHKVIIQSINKVKSPYNLNTVTQQLAITALENTDRIKDYIKEVKIERAFLYKELLQLPLKVYESRANFIFFKSHILNLNKYLEEYGILIRSFSKDLNNFYRVTIGSPEENKEFIKSIKEIYQNENK